jgi:dihydrofolate synthase/folylpolyglutamate synthase
MNYKEAINWLNGFQQFGIKLGLERITQICKKLGDPQKNYQIVHVGGTNGKGSVCRFIGNILTKSGYKTGVYTSPHLQRFSERFIIDNKEISESDIIKLVNKVKPIVDEMIKKDDPPTYFEIVTAMAFQYFNDKKVEYAIIEVGLGGRFDATNIVNPLVSVITNVSLEHQDRLGKKIEDIAFEKAGIIKHKIPVVTGASGKALEVIKEKMMENNNSVIVVDKNFWEKTAGGIDWQEFIVHGVLKDHKLRIGMPGVFQGENLAVAMATVEILQMNGVYITDDSIFEGVEETNYPGRMEIISYEPLILLDGAHNIEGIRVLKETFEKDFVYNKLVLVFGVLSDKNIDEMLKTIVPIADIVITTKSSNKRACEPSKLKQMIQKLDPGKEIVVKERIKDAIDHAKSVAKKDDLVCITGSIFTVGEARNLLIKT